MKYSKLMACILILALLWAGFAGCKYKLAFVPAEESTAAPETTAAPTTEPTTEEPTTEDPVAAAGIIEDNSFREAAMDKAGVLALYTETVNDVKRRCPGFTKSVTLDTENVTAGEGGMQLAQRVMNLVVSEFLNAEGGAVTETLAPHSDIRVLEVFPVCGRDYGCALTNLDLIDSAVCYTDGKVYKLVITVHQTINPAPDSGEFCKIMTPIERQSVAGSISSLLQKLDLGQYLFDFNYRDNEITCILDRETGRILSLSQRNVVRVDISLGKALFFMSAVEAHGTVLHKLEFTDFIWD